MAIQILGVYIRTKGVYIYIRYMGLSKSWLISFKWHWNVWNLAPYTCVANISSASTSSLPSLQAGIYTPENSLHITFHFLHHSTVCQHCSHSCHLITFHFVCCDNSPSHRERQNPLASDSVTLTLRTIFVHKFLKMWEQYIYLALQYHLHFT